MKLSDFDFDLPPNRIAQRPLEPRDSAKLMVLDKNTGSLEHLVFRDLPDLLGPADLLVWNTTRVIPARLVGRKEKTGASVELLVVHRFSEFQWKALIRRIKRVRPNQRIVFGPGFSATVVETGKDGRARVSFESDLPVEENLKRYGRTPLPPYIRRGEDVPSSPDREAYQTVYADRDGSVAAPTAGLHFTREVIDRLVGKGIPIRNILLHVGPGTFQPVRTERVEDHRMESEWMELPEETARSLNEARALGKRIVAVGSTTTRALESSTPEEGGPIRAGSGWTDCFILPGYQFKTVGAMITNFHLPRSTLLMLVCAFAGRENILRAYREAVQGGYRFYSYGDAMLIR